MPSRNTSNSEYYPSPPGLRLRSGPRKAPAQRVRIGAKGNACGGTRMAKISYSH